MVSGPRVPDERSERACASETRSGTQLETREAQYRTEGATSGAVVSPLDPGFRAQDARSAGTRAGPTRQT